MKRYIEFNQSGFTFIEVLVAMGLIMIFLLNFEKTRLYLLQASQQSLFQLMARERLVSLQSFLLVNSSRAQHYFSQWKSDNKYFLPNANAEMRVNGSHYVLRFYWRSSLAGFWYCKTNPIKQLACEELSGES